MPAESQDGSRKRQTTASQGKCLKGFFRRFLTFWCTKFGGFVFGLLQQNHQKCMENQKIHGHPEKKHEIRQNLPSCWLNRPVEKYAGQNGFIFPNESFFFQFAALLVSLSRNMRATNYSQRLCHSRVIVRPHVLRTMVKACFQNADLLQ